MSDAVSKFQRHKCGSASQVNGTGIIEETELTTIQNFVYVSEIKRWRPGSALGTYNWGIIKELEHCVSATSDLNAVHPCTCDRDPGRSLNQHH